MISQLRSLNPLNIVLVIIAGFLLRIVPLYDLPVQLSFNFSEPFARLLLSPPDVSPFEPFSNIFTAYVLILIQAFLFNYIVNSYNLLGKQSYLPAFIYVITSSILIPFLLLSPALVCNFLLLWILFKLLGVYKADNSMALMFDVGMITAAGTIIYFPFIAVLPLTWISLLIFKPFNWREWVAAITGYATIFFFLGVYYFWNDSFGDFFKIWLPLAAKFPALNINIYDYLVLIPVIAIVGLGLIYLRQNFFRSVVQVRKSFQFLFFLFFFTLVSFYLKPGYRDYHFILCIVPVSVIMAYYFLNARVKWFYEGMFVLFFCSIIYFQLY